MKLHKYKSYDEYYDLQVKCNASKIDNVWAKEKYIKKICEYIKGSKRGLCHGVRNGKEVEFFKKYLPGCKVIGTEISPTANNYKNVIEWDFHDIKKEWLSRHDFIYTNSFDHAYNPAKAIVNWIKSLKKGGILIIEHTKRHEESTRYDPFGAEFKELKVFICEMLRCKAEIIDIIDFKDGRQTKEIIIKKIMNY